MLERVNIGEALGRGPGVYIIFWYYYYSHYYYYYHFYPRESWGWHWDEEGGLGISGYRVQTLSLSVQDATGQTVDWTAYKQQKKFFHSSGGWSLRAGCQHGRVLVRALFWVADCSLPVVSLNRRKSARELSGVPFIGALISFLRTPPSYLITSQRPHLQIPPHWESGF